MARKKPTQSRPKRTKAKEFRGYVKYEITKDEKVEYLEWAGGTEIEFLWLELEQLVDSGYKFATKTDSYGGGVQASLTCAEDTNDDCGLVLTARAPDLRNAMLLLLYKHLHLLKGEWSIYHDETKAVSEWG